MLMQFGKEIAPKTGMTSEGFIVALVLGGQRRGQGKKPKAQQKDGWIDRCNNGHKDNVKGGKTPTNNEGNGSSEGGGESEN